LGDSLDRRSTGSSKAPMSGRVACGRGTPRWSCREKLVGDPAFTAGLPGRSAIVLVGPPKSVKTVRRGSTLFKLARFVKRQVESEQRL
jgi:hypothetical protein